MNNGEVVSRVEGRCDQGCGSITITSGEWRRAQNPDRFTRCAPREPDSRREWALGNRLTFHNPESGEFGRRRFGHNEGFHGALVSRFQLTKGKRWYRRRDGTGGHGADLPPDARRRDGAAQTGASGTGSSATATGRGLDRRGNRHL